MLGSLSLLCAFEQGQVEFELTIIFYYPQGGLIRPYFKTIQCTWTIISCEKVCTKRKNDICMYNEYFRAIFFKV